VSQGGPAYNAGIRAGDYITAIKNRYVTTVEQLVEEIHKLTPGSRVPVRFRRNTSLYDAFIVTAGRTPVASQASTLH